MIDYSIMASGYILALTLFIVAAAADPFIREVVINRLKTHDIPNIPLFKGIINGNLNPYCYTRFLNQDSYYLNWSVHLWETAHNISSSDPSFQKFSHVMFEQMKVFAGKLRQSINLNTSGVIPNNVTLNYTRDQAETLNANGFYYVLLVNYACAASWTAISQMIQPLTRKENNPYYIWIEENQDYEYASIFENKIAEYQKQFKDGWINIIERMVDHEVAFFTAVCTNQNDEQQL